MGTPKGCLGRDRIRGPLHPDVSFLRIGVGLAHGRLCIGSDSCVCENGTVQSTTGFDWILSAGSLFDMDAVKSLHILVPRGKSSQGSLACLVVK